MEIAIIILLVFVIAIITGLVFWLASANSSLRRDIANQAGQVEVITKSLDSYRQTQESLRDTLSKSMLTSQESVSKSLQTNLQTIGDLKKEISQLQTSNKNLAQVGEDVKKLHGILANPKMRGQMGEWSLENLLSNVLPQDSYKLQHHFSDGKIVDALINLPDYSVPIDAKFPLPAFQAMTEVEDESERLKLRKTFISDIKKHIDKIATQYIKPNEGTLDFAFMYIPAENVYYETIIKYKGDATDVLSYAHSKKVIPISPNVCYAYLMTVVMGLHGLQIEKQASEIRKGLTSLKGRFSDFFATWELMGKHLRNTSAQYQQGQTQLDKFNLEMEKITETDEDK